MSNAHNRRMLRFMLMLHIGGPLHGQTLDAPEDRLTYVPEGLTVQYIQQRFDGEEVFAEHQTCFRKARLLYRRVKRDQ